MSTTNPASVPVQVTIYTTPERAAQIENGEAFYNGELVTTDLPETEAQRARVPQALDALAFTCEAGVYCNFSVAGTKRIGVVCRELASLVRIADATPGMFNMRSWARYTIAVLATENITYTGNAPMPAAIEEQAIRAMEEDLEAGVAIFAAQRDRLLGITAPAKAA